MSMIDDDENESQVQTAQLEQEEEMDPAVEASGSMDGDQVSVDLDIDPDMEEQENGDVVLYSPEDDRPLGQGDFDANLADILNPSDLRTIAAELIDLVEFDKESRKKRDEQYEEGMRRTGLGDDAPGGAQFNGASKVVHPVLAEACVDFAARAIKELFPPDGPVRIKISGPKTPEAMAKAERKRVHMNWQLTEECEEYRSELEQLLTQLPLGGSQYMKWSWDPDQGRPVPQFIPVDDIFIPYAASSFYTATRITHRQYLTIEDYLMRVESGLYRDVDIASGGLDPDRSATAAAADKIEGRERTGFNEDGIREVYEIYCLLEIDEDQFSKGKFAPYIVTIDEATGDVLGFYRNWDPNDARMKRIDYITEYQFIPWRGAYGIGLFHLIGGMAAALTGSLRALLDTAHINNSATLLKLKGNKISGQTTSIDPTQVAEIEGGTGVVDPDIRKMVMPVPFNPPSQVLFELMMQLDKWARGVTGTALETISQMNPNAPVGTTYAIMEQAATVFSSIHGRLHQAQAKSLRVLHRLNKQYLDDNVVVEQLGGPIVSRADYDGPMDLVPVSDPNMFTDMQRLSQIQAVDAMAQQTPQFFDLRAIKKRMLTLLKVPNPEELMPEPPKPMPMDPVIENLGMASGRPAQAFPDQDHIAHLMVHVKFMQDPLLGANPLVRSQFLPQVLLHITQHLGLLYGQTTYSSVGVQALVGQLQPLPPPQAAQLAAAMNKSVDQVHQQLNQVLQQLLPLMQQGFQEMQAAQQQGQPMDPSIMAMVQAQQAETERKAQRDQMEMAQKEKDSQRKASLEKRNQDIDARTSATKITSEFMANEDDNETRLQIEEAKIAADANSVLRDTGFRNR